MVGRLLSGLSYSDGTTRFFIIVLLLLVSGSVITKNPFIAIYISLPIPENNPRVLPKKTPRFLEPTVTFVPFW